MHIEMYITPPRRRVENPRRDRACLAHLLIRAILDGKPKHLASVSSLVQAESVSPILEKCRQRLAGICDDPEQLSKFLAQIEARLSREVLATAKAREARQRELDQEDGGR
jgi:hypothetical protein